MRTSDLLSRIEARASSLLTPGSSVLAAVSGGADSVFLLRVLHELKHRMRIGRLGVLHVNHGLRGRDSDEDERFVTAVAGQLNCPVFPTRLHGRCLHDPGIEAWAREERYRFFHCVKEREGFDCIATGHTADDQAETVFLRLMRGSGIRGLRGILPHREDGVIRPLIDLSRAEIVEWLESHDIAYRHDSSNDDLSLMRNRVRHLLLPAMERHEAGARGKLVAIAGAARGCWESMQPGIVRWVESHVSGIREDGFSIDKKGFSDDLYVSEALRSLLERFHVAADSPHIERVVREASRTSGMILLSDGWKCHFGRHVLIFERIGMVEAEPFRCAIAVPGSTDCPEGRARFTAEEFFDLEGHPLPSDNHTVVLDRDVCGDELVYRSWRREDRFQPFGAKTEVCVPSFLAKQRIPLPVRRRLGVVEGKDNRIVWIPGVRIGQEARVTPYTRDFVKVSYRSY